MLHELRTQISREIVGEIERVVNRLRQNTGVYTTPAKICNSCGQYNSTSSFQCPKWGKDEHRQQSCTVETRVKSLLSALTEVDMWPSTKCVEESALGVRTKLDRLLCQSSMPHACDGRSFCPLRTVYQELRDGIELCLAFCFGPSLRTVKYHDSRIFNERRISNG